MKNKITNRLLSCALALMMALTLLPVTALAADTAWDDGTGSGDGTSGGTPYILNNEVQLRSHATAVNGGADMSDKYFKLGDDITLTGPWTPIGNATNHLILITHKKRAIFAADAVRWACGAGIIAGRPGKLIEPRGTATRAEAAAMLHRMLDAAL